MNRRVCGLLFLALLGVIPSGVALAGPILTVINDGNGRYLVGIDPDGEDGYTAVEVTVTAGTFRNFINPVPDPQFVPGDFTGVLGNGTITGGFSVLGIEATNRQLSFTFTSLGGPPTTSFSGYLAQVVAEGIICGTATARFADANGREIRDFETSEFFFCPEPTTAIMTAACVTALATWRRHRLDRIR